MDNERDNELKNSSYELFILALSLLSVFNWLIYFAPLSENARNIIISVDLLLSLIFMCDFLFRLLSAESKSNYLFRQYGWLDFLSSLPFPQVRILRLGRIARALRLLRKFGLRGIVREFLESQAGTAMYTVAFLIVLVLEFGSLAILSAEQYASGANITTATDAIWWSLVTVSTVGYGDYYPVTFTGRLIGMVVIVVGVGLFGVVTAFLAERFLGNDKDESRSENAGTPPRLQTDTILDEIIRLRREQEQANQAINARLDELFKQMQQEV